MRSFLEKVPCKDLTEEAIARASSEKHAVDKELQPHLAGLLAAHCEECSYL